MTASPSSFSLIQRLQRLEEYLNKEGGTPVSIVKDTIAHIQTLERQVAQLKAGTRVRVDPPRA